MSSGLFVIKQTALAGVADDILDGIGDAIAPEMDISKDDVRKVRSFVAEDMEKPSFTLLSFPEGQYGAGQSASLSIAPSGFGDGGAYTTWCIDQVPVTHIGAGSEDRFVRKDGKRTLSNDYGAIMIPPNGYDICSSKVLNKLGNFALTGKEAGRIGNKETKAIPAEPLINGKEKPTHPPLSSDHWFDFVRVPNVDTDHDGLDDEWEVNYFSGRLKPPSVARNRDTPIQDRTYPVDRTAILRIVRPQDDPDKDGWTWNISYDEFPFTFPGGVAQDPFSFPWQIGIPGVFIPEERRNAGTSGYGDMATVDLGKWNGQDESTGCTNLIEYTFGTDPLESDTDSDTATDCIDIAGFNQTKITVPLDKKAGDSYVVEVHAFTLNGQWRGSGIESSGAATQPSRNQRLQANKYIRIDYRDVQRSSQGEGIELQLTREPEIVTTKTTGRLGQDRIRVEAIPLTRNIDLSTLDFTWFLNGVHQEKSSGAGKRFFFFNVDDPLPSGRLVTACQQHTVTVNVIDPRTESSANARILIDVVPPVEFVKSIVGHVDRSRDGVKESTETPSEEAGDVRQGARSGDVVKFEASLLGVAENKTAAQRGDESEKECGVEGMTLDQLTYKWSLDGRVDQEQTGRGVKYATAQFEITRKGITSPQQASSQFEQTTGSGHIVTLEVFGPTGRLLTAKDERLNAVAPNMELSIRGETLEVNSKAAQEVLSVSVDIDYLVKEGDTVTISANPVFFAPDSEISLIAKRNDMETDLGNSKEFTFKVGKAGTVEIVSINGTSEVGEQGGAQLQLRVVTEQELKSVLERRSVIGALIEFIPPALRDSLRLVLGGGIFAAVLLIAMLFLSPRTKTAPAIQHQGKS